MPRILPSKKPFARGVTQLMYVGDSEPSLGSDPVRLLKVVGAAGLAYAALGSNAKARMASGLGGAALILFAIGSGS